MEGWRGGGGVGGVGGGDFMRGIKIPQQEIALKCRGGAYARRDVRDTTVYEWKYCNYSNTTYDPV